MKKIFLILSSLISISAFADTEPYNPFVTEKWVLEIPAECRPMKLISRRSTELKFFAIAKTVKKGDSKESILERFGKPDEEKEVFGGNGIKLKGSELRYDIHKQNGTTINDVCDTYISIKFNESLGVEKFAFKRGKNPYKIIETD